MFAVVKRKILQSSKRILQSSKGFKASKDATYDDNICKSLLTLWNISYSL